jgi:rRNA maturation endonuclease Nob1
MEITKEKKLVAEVRLKIFISDTDKQISEIQQNIKDYIIDGKYTVTNVKIRLLKLKNIPVAAEKFEFKCCDCGVYDSEGDICKECGCLCFTNEGDKE